MKKNLASLSLAAFTFLALFFAGCSSSEKASEETSYTPPVTSAPAQDTLNLGASSAGRAH